jgi:probable rRNA maturation factor
MTSPTVFGYDEQTARPVELDRWVALATAALVAEGVAEGELTLAFVDEADMAELNAEHMGESYATDVLSFPLDAPSPTDRTGAAPVPGTGEPLLLGDVVLCPAVAAAQAADHAGTYDDELALLIVHGVLHVLGHDHDDADDAVAMRARELALLEQLHWRGPKPATFTAHERTNP